MKNIEKILKALANRRRLEILRLLKSKRALSVGEISDGIKLSFKSTSRHLSVLSSAELVETEKVSLSVFYHLAQPLNPITKTVLEHI